MKKMWKLTAGAVSVVILLSAYYLLKDYHSKQETENQESEQDTTEIFTVNEEDVKSLRFTLEDGEVSFKKEENGWIKEDDPDFPVNEETISTLTDQLCSFDADRILKNVDNLSEYGLQEPSNTVSIEEEDKEIVFHIGNMNESTGQYYVNLDDSKNTVYVVEASQITPFQGKLYDFAKGDTFPAIVSGDVKKIQVDKEEDPYILQASDHVSSGWLVGESEEDLEDADSAEAYTLLSSVGTLSYGEFVDYKCDEPEKYGLDTPSAILTVDYEETVQRETEDKLEAEGESAMENNSEDEPEAGGEIIVDDELEKEDGSGSDDESESTPQNGNDDSNEETNKIKVEKQMVLIIGDTCENGYYVNLQGTDQVYVMGSDDLSSIIDKRAGDFWNLTVSYIPIAEMKEFTVEDGISSITISSKEEAVESDSEDETENTNDADAAESETETVYYLDGEKVDGTSFLSFYSAVVNVGAQQRLEDVYEPEKDPEISFSFRKKNGDTIKISYYSYDNNFYIGMRSDGKNYLVNKMTVKDLKESLDEFLSC